LPETVRRDLGGWCQYGSGMLMRRGHPRWGLTFDWLATDSLGQVGYLDSAGYGAVPGPVTVNAELADLATEQVPELPVTGEAWTTGLDCPSRMTEYWSSLAERGFFAYSWFEYRGPYQLISAPSKAIHIDQLPRTIAAAARVHTFAGNFRESIEINMEYEEPHDNTPGVTGAVLLAQLHIAYPSPLLLAADRDSKAEDRFTDAHSTVYVAADAVFVRVLAGTEGAVDTRVWRGQAPTDREPAFLGGIDTPSGVIRIGDANNAQYLELSVTSGKQAIGIYLDRARSAALVDVVLL